MENENKTQAITAEVIDYEDEEYWDDYYGMVTVRTYKVVVHDPTNKHERWQPWEVTDFCEPISNPYKLD